MIILAPFVSPQNFLGPKLDEDGNPTGPIEYEGIVKERYLISKRMNTSYSDLGSISVHERRLLLKFIGEEIAQEKEAINSLNYKNKSAKK